MICPKCKRGKLEAVKTAHLRRKEAVRRVRACTNTGCGFSRVTFEHIPMDIPTVPPDQRCDWFTKYIVNRTTLDTANLLRHLRGCSECREKTKVILSSHGKSVRNFRMENGVHSFDTRRIDDGA